MKLIRHEVLRPALSLERRDHLQKNDSISSEMPKDDGTGSSAKTTSTYSIQKGDTLFSIAKRYMTTVDAIKKENNLKDNTIESGENLNITN